MFIELHEGKKCMLVEFRANTRDMWHHVTPYTCGVCISRKCSVCGERVYTGENNDANTNNVFCKHVSICL